MAHDQDPTTLDELRAALHTITARLDAFEQQHRHEVRTQRVVVVDSDDIERVVLSAQLRTGSVLVRVPDRDNATTGTELYASEDVDGDGPHSGAVIWQHGTQVAHWTNHGPTSTP